MIELFNHHHLDSNHWKPDFHTHTTASDGSLNPGELIRYAAKCGVNLISVTDHDTLSGLENAQKAAVEFSIRLTPGIEVSAEGDLDIHILAFGISSGCRAFDEMIDTIQLDRITREIKYLDQLKRIGMTITHEELKIPEGTLFSRPLLAKAMVKKGYASNIQEAFRLFLLPGKPTYVPKVCVRAEDVINNIHLSGAVGVLAHPGKLKLDNDQLETYIKHLKDAGLMGIEVYHPSHSPSELKILLKIAFKYDLLVTGGSDFHFKGDSFHGELGQMLSSWEDSSAHADKLLDYIDL